MRRIAGLVAALASLVMVLTSCGTGPGQLNTAVIINGQAISVDEVQGILNKIVREEPAAKPLARQHKLDLVAREIVSQLILHELINQAAEREKISVDPEQLSKAVESGPLDKLPDDGSVPPEALVTELAYRGRDFRDYAADQLLLAKLADRYLAGTTVTVGAVLISGASETGGGAADPKAEAEDMGRRIAADPSVLENEIAKAQQGQGATAGNLELISAELGVNPGEQQVNPTQRLLPTSLLSAPVNSVAVFQFDPSQNAWFVGLIRERTLEPDADVEVLEQPDPRLLLSFGERLVQALAGKTDMRISPRYGIWDPASMGVVASEAERTGLVLPAKSSRS